MKIDGVRNPIYRRWCLGKQEAKVGWETLKTGQP